MGQKIRKIVFPVGGLGTRFLPATKALPKEMLPIVDKPLIHYAFEEAQEAGIEQFIFITGRNKNAINNHFDHAYELQKTLDEKKKDEELHLTTHWLPEPGNILFIRQQQPLGLGHAIWCARHAVGNEPFAVILADELIQAKRSCLAQMTDAYASHSGCNMLGVAEVPKEKVNRYGIIEPVPSSSKKNEMALIPVRTLVEKPAPEKAPSNWSIVGRYILQPGIFDILEEQAAGAGGEIQLTDAINRMVSQTPTFGHAFTGKRFDCGERAGFVEANLAFALANPELRERIQAMLKQYV